MRRFLKIVEWVGGFVIFTLASTILTLATLYRMTP